LKYNYKKLSNETNTAIQKKGLADARKYRKG